jgi:hypothetical protein
MEADEEEADVDERLKQDEWLKQSVAQTRRSYPDFDTHTNPITPLNDRLLPPTSIRQPHTIQRRKMAVRPGPSTSFLSFTNRRWSDLLKSRKKIHAGGRLKKATSARPT